MSQKSLLMLFDNVEILKSLNTFFNIETKENLLTFISQKILVLCLVFVTREYCLINKKIVLKKKIKRNPTEKIMLCVI